MYSINDNLHATEVNNWNPSILLTYVNFLSVNIRNKNILINHEYYTCLNCHFYIIWIPFKHDSISEILDYRPW